MKITKLEVLQVRYLVIHKKIKSISYVQRKLGIGYNKARMIVESINNKKNI